MSTEIKYYLFYYVDDCNEFNLYAYTSDKEEAKNFKRFRNETFIMKKKKLDLGERNFLCLMHSDSRIRLYEFTFNNNKFKIPLAYKEILYLEAVTAKADILLPSCAKINPMIFKEKIAKALEYIRYNEFFLKYHIGTDTMIESDKFYLFIREYGRMLNMTAIRNEVVP